MSCSGKSFEIFIWEPKADSYIGGEPVRNGYGDLGAVPNYGRMYQTNTPGLRNSPYIKLSMSNPIINYNTRTITEYNTYSSRTLSDTNLKISFEESNIDNISDIAADEMIKKLEAKIIETKNGTREIFANDEQN